MREQFFEQHNQDENHPTEEQKKIEILKKQSDFSSRRLQEAVEEKKDGELNHAQREALRKILIENNVRVNMYKQFDESLHSSVQGQDARIIDMKPVDKEDSNEDRFRKAI